MIYVMYVYMCHVHDICNVCIYMCVMYMIYVMYVYMCHVHDICNLYIYVSCT